VTESLRNAEGILQIPAQICEDKAVPDFIDLQKSLSKKSSKFWTVTTSRFPNSGETNILMKPEGCGTFSTS
jgi:hypothetical protein